MRTTPSHENSAVNRDDSSETPAHSTHKSRRQAPLAPEQFATYDDEHPNIPVTRRASRYLDDAALPPTTRSGQRTPLARRARLNDPASANQAATRTPRQRIARVPRQAPDEEGNLNTGRSSRYTRQPTTRANQSQSTHMNATRPPRSRMDIRDARDAHVEEESQSRTGRRRFERLQDIFLTDDILEAPQQAEARQRTHDTSRTRLRAKQPSRSEQEILAEDDIYNDDIYEEDIYNGVGDANAEQEQMLTTTERQRTVRPPSATNLQPATQRSHAPASVHTTHARLHRPQQLAPLYEPTSAYGIQQRVGRRAYRQQQAVQSRWQQLLHNRTFLTVSSIILVLLILFTLISVKLYAPATTQVSSPRSTAPAATQPVQIPKPTDPHELVVIPPAGNTHPAPPVLATSAYLLDANSGATLYAHNPFMHIPMMSTTKLMTALLTVERIKNLDEPVKIDAQITNDLNTQLSPDSSIMGVKKNETYTVRELLYGLFLVSGNDAAIVLADHISGNVPAFVKLMNQRAQQLGLVDTHYANPHGLLDNDHYSSAHDLAFLAKIVFDNQTLVQISGTQSYHIVANSRHAEHFMQNGDQFLYWYPGVNAGKTGWDAAQNFVQVISCVRGNRHLIGVVMHTDDWWTDMRNLMDYGFNNYTWISPRELTLNGDPVPFAAEWSYFRIDTRDHSIPMGSNGRFYNFTGYGISGPILTYFDKNKGLQKLGLPTSQPQASGTDSLMQRFQHGNVTCDLKAQQCKAAS
jgi:D-alanyl-D-alanine carboxypeptidase